jgi:uncharacterized protein
MRFGMFRIILQSLLFLGHLLFYWTLVNFFGVHSPRKRRTLKLVLGMLFLSLIPASLLASRYSNLWVTCFYTAAASWVGIIYIFVLASIVCWTLYGLAKLFHLRLNKKMLIEVLIGMAVMAILYGFINSGVIRTTRITLHLHDLPGEWKGRHAVWVSDTHLGPVRNKGFARQVATLIRNLRPDIVFIGGDFFDGESVDLDKIIEPFSHIPVPYGIYFITGNHEEFSDKTPYLQVVRKVGMRVLNNEMVKIMGLQIIGVNYRDTRRPEQYKEILQKIKINPLKPSILLRHSPLLLEIAKDQGISLQLSGHTHQGQVLLFRFITSQVYHGYDYGLKWFSDLQVFTSSGAGTWGPPLRIDTKPEIVFITFAGSD